MALEWLTFQPQAVEMKLNRFMHVLFAFFLRASDGSASR
jgi:hypothetical protein